MKLNLGCASDVREGYNNVDLHSKNPNVIISDVRDLSFVQDGEAEEVIAQDVLEHIPFQDSPACIKEWCRVLAPEGRIFIQTTNFEEFVKTFTNKVWDIKTINYMMFAGKGWIDGVSRDQDWHKSIYTAEHIFMELAKNGVEVESARTDYAKGYCSGNLNLHIWGKKLT
tara:strand:+ start:1531 stop:2037 length:507 start_codon:yes stop_codon:yes gene_type:complete